VGALEASRTVEPVSYHFRATGRVRPQGTPPYACRACACHSILAAGRLVYAVIPAPRLGLALVSNDDRKVWPKVFGFLPFSAIERQLQQPLIALRDAENML
jgi:hypothetical protein